MDNHTATELAYKNGYEQGKKDAVRHGRWVKDGDFLICLECESEINIYYEAAVEALMKTEEETC